MTILIVEDDTEISQSLKNKLEFYCTDSSVVGICTDVLSGYKQINLLKPDLIFLDIHLGKQSGFDLLELFETPFFETIIISGDNKFGIEAVKHQVLDYILKPINYKELIRAVEKAKQKTLHYQFLKNQRNLNDTLVISTGDKLHILPIQDITAIKADRNYSWIYLQNKEKYYASNLIKEMEEKLPMHQFCRVHKSYIVNIKKAKNFINKSNGSHLVMIDGKIIPVSESKKKELLKILKL